MTDDHRAALRGRRQSDQIFDGWTWGRVIRIATALTLLGGIGAAVVSFTAATVVTRPELIAVSEKVDTLQSHTEARFRQIEGRQAQADSVRALLIPMARLQCLQLERWQSGTLAGLAGLPCDSLLRRIR